MNISELTPDVVLAALLDGRLTVQTSATERRDIRCYADGKMPNKGLPDEFVTVVWNGAARSLTIPISCFVGDIVLTVYCKTQTDGTVKTQRVRQILAQCQTLVDDVTADGFYFKLNPRRLIVPTTGNLSTGYSTTAINVEWRTIN